MKNSWLLSLIGRNMLNGLHCYDVLLQVNALRFMVVDKRCGDRAEETDRWSRDQEREREETTAHKEDL